MTQPDLARLEGLLANIGPLPIDPIWMYEAIRHAQRNMDLDVAEGFCEPDRYAGSPIGELINALPALLARVRELAECRTYREGVEAAAKVAESFRQSQRDVDMCECGNVDQAEYRINLAAAIRKLP